MLLLDYGNNLLAWTDLLKGAEQITQFALDGWWISDYQSFMNNSPSDYYLQTIEESISLNKQEIYEQTS